MPLFAPSGTILPLGPDLQYSTEKPWNPIELRVYPGRDARFVLYTDDGLTNDYLRRGERGTVELRWRDRTRTLEIGPWQGRRGGLIPLPVTFRVVAVKQGRGAGIDPAGEAVTVRYSGAPLRLRVP